MSQDAILEEFALGLWIAAGAECVVAGFRYPTRMVIVRLANGGLWVWSPVALGPELRRAVDRLGPVRHVVAPNSLHHVFLAEWLAAYPEARVHAAPGLATKRSDLRFDADLSDAPDPDWEGEIAQVVVEGNLITREVVFLHAASGTVLFTDLIQHFPKRWFAGWRAVVARLDLMAAEAAEVPRKFRLAFVNRGAARRAVRRILDWPVEHVIMAHGAPIRGGGAAALRRIFRWLVR